MINLANALYHLGQFTLQLQHEAVEIFWQLSNKTCNSDDHLNSLAYYAQLITAAL